MEYNTSELCNLYADLIDVVEPIFSNYGGRCSFGGQVVTIKCFENNGLIRQMVEQDGEGKIRYQEISKQKYISILKQSLQCPSDIGKLCIILTFPLANLSLLYQDVISPLLELFKA